MRRLVSDGVPHAGIIHFTMIKKYFHVHLPWTASHPGLAVFPSTLVSTALEDIAFACEQYNFLQKT